MTLYIAHDDTPQVIDNAADIAVDTAAWESE